ncbi:methyltransferase domain-containing protein [Noviherbaspirillum cavernae]|uniref:Methyltransferase domain-containing protein n=1 Tax=Noviherbaspirillum cavernae TaxID=2320862 RepID=A0A418WXT7_9BURK|nr:methyltransferase domain-containing protein [Noviherbaspirillum cavernae]RJG05001.1 methyltransferase domain-containing protein [Noviherbaspirillum cavernae]
MPTFETRDPSASAFWTERFAHQFTPWDRGGVPAALRRFVAQSSRPLVTLIPGCGTGYEVACLSEAGWDVIAIDFSPAAVQAARAVLGGLAERVVMADFFEFEPPRPLDCIYERAFLCALPRDKWPLVVRRWSELLSPGGLLAAFFYFDNSPKGPPFGADAGELAMLLAPHFEMIDDQPVEDSVPVFEGRERWQVWRRI